MFAMATKKKTKLESTARRMAAILEDHIATLPPAEAKGLLSDIHQLAVKSSRSSNRLRLAAA
jgi:hypothetical protein